MSGVSRKGSVGRPAGGALVVRSLRGCVLNRRSSSIKNTPSANFPRRRNDRDGRATEASRDGAQPRCTRLLGHRSPEPAGPRPPQPAAPPRPPAAPAPGPAMTLQASGARPPARHTDLNSHDILANAARPRLEGAEV